MYPANGAIYFFGQSISLAKVAATIDGRPATLVADTNELTSSYGTLVAKLDPLPAQGQAVQISGDFCAVDSPCEQQTITFTAGPADTTPPGPIEVSFNVHDYPDFQSSGGDCQSESDVAYWVHVKASGAEDAGAPVLYRAVAARDASFQDIVATRTVAASIEEETRIAFRQLIETLGGKAPGEALCFRVTAFDAAGNVATQVVDTCDPCYLRAGGEPSLLVPGEPEWTAADVYPGGACDDEGGEGQPEGEGGSSGSGVSPGSGYPRSGYGSGETSGGCRIGHGSPEGVAAGLPLLALAAAALVGRAMRRRNAA